MTIISLDPGPTQTAWLTYRPDQERPIYGFNTEPNEEVLGWLQRRRDESTLAIEMVASYGMAVGKEVFETVRWIGKFEQAWHPSETKLIYRRDVKLYLCNSAKAKDGNVRQALIDRFGGSSAIGLKKSPGVLYGISKHTWSALAIAVYAASLQEQAVSP